MLFTCGRRHWCPQAATEEIFTTLFIKLSHFHLHLLIKYISHLFVFHPAVILLSRQESRGDDSTSSETARGGSKITCYRAMEYKLASVTRY